MPTRTVVCAALAALLAAPAGAQQDRNPDRTVYVPIEEFDEIFDREKGGVFVPYHELLELLDKAQGPSTTPPTQVDEAPPTDYVLVGAKLKGTAGEAVVQFEATFDIEVLRDDAWVIVPIGLGEAALEDVQTSTGQRAVVGPMQQLVEQLQRQQPRRAKGQRELPQSGYGIIIKGAGRLQTTARFAVPISSRPGQSSFGISLPQAALCNFEVDLPQSGLRVNVANALATEATSDDGNDRTQVRAYFGAAETAQVTWNPRPKEVEGAEAREPLLFAETQSSFFLDEGVLQVTSHIDYRILQAPCGSFVVRFPNGYTLLGVDGQNMSADPVPQQTEQGQTITVRLHEKAADSYALTLRLEKILGESATQRIEYPRVETIGTERESGVLAARTSKFLTLEPASLRGLSQLDASKLSDQQRKDLRWDPRSMRPPLVFRYLRQPFTLELKSSQIEPEVDGKVFTLSTIRDDEIEQRTVVSYTINKRGIFGVRVKLPAGYDVRECGPDQHVKDWRVSDDVLQVDFVSQQEGGFNLYLVGLVRREGGAEAQGLKLPVLELLDVKKETGVLGVAAQQHLKLTKVKDQTKVLLDESVRDLRGLGFPHGVANADEQLMYGFKYGKRDGVATAFDVSKREPKVTARVETLVDAQEDQISVSSTVRFLVEYAGVEQVRIQVPAALNSDKELKIEGDAIKDPRVSFTEGDEHAVWTIPLQGKRTGEFAVELSYDIKLEDFSPGEREVKTLHEIEVLDCFTETGDIALTKHENLVITDELEMLDRRDKQELPEALRRHGPIQAYRYTDHPHQLTLHLVKYDFQAPLGIVIRHLHLDEVVSQDGKIQVEAWLSVQNNAEQFLTVLLPADAEYRGLKVDGRTESPSDGPALLGRKTLLIPLGDVGQGGADRPFQVRIRYNLPGEGDLSGLGRLVLGTEGGREAGRALEFPSGEGESVPVARLTRRTWLPQDLAYLDFDTDATKHFQESSLWEELKGMLGVRTGRERINTYAGASAANQAIAQLQALAPGAQDLGDYPPLEEPQGQEPYLFEKLDNPSKLSVRYSAWTLFYLFDVLALLAVVGLGVFLDARKLVGPVVFVSLSAALMVLGANFGGRSLEPFFASGLVGSLGLGVFFLGRGIWSELTVKRHQRRLAELAEEAQVAKARAQAAEAESKLRSGAPAAAAVAVTPKAETLTEAERRAAADMPLDAGADADGGSDASGDDGQQG